MNIVIGIPNMITLNWWNVSLFLACLVVIYFGVKVLLWYLDKHW